jgi:type IV secretion system protein VirD4
MQDRTRADVFATARGAVWPWSDRDVMSSSNGCDLTLDWLIQPDRANTMYIAAPLADTDRLKPALGGAIDDILNQLYVHCTRTHQPLEPPLLLVLDEIGNTPLRDLPRHVSVLSGLGVQIATVWQSVAQIHTEYREAAATVIGNHRTKVLFSGISDGVTGELAAKLLGDEQVLSRQLSSDLGQLDGGRRSLSESLVTTSIVPAHVLREQTPGSALLIHGHLPPAHLQVRSQFSDPLLLERASMPLPRQPQPPRRPKPPGSRPSPDRTNLADGPTLADTTATTAQPDAAGDGDDRVGDDCPIPAHTGRSTTPQRTNTAPKLRIVPGG